MSTYSLSGTGTHAVTTNTTALRITVTTLPAISGQGRANPPNVFDVGLLRFGDGTAYFSPIPVTGGPQWCAVPTGTTTIGYALLHGAVISVEEVIGGTPPFTGTASSTPTNPTVIEAFLSSPVSVSATTLTDILSVTLGAGTWIVVCDVNFSASSASHGEYRITDGSTTYGGARDVIGGTTWHAHTSVRSKKFTLTGSTVITLQIKWEQSGTVAASTSANSWGPATTMHALQVA